MHESKNPQHVLFGKYIRTGTGHTKEM